MLIVEGAKGGKGGDSGGGGKESPNTLRSNTRARVVDLLCEGEIVGLVTADGNPVDGTNWGQAIFLDGTPIQNEIGQNYYTGVGFTQRVGLPDQAALAGFNQAETPFSVETQVKFGAPVVKTILDDEISAVRVVVRLPALVYQNKESGDMTGASVSYRFDVRAPGGDWTEVVVADIVNQKCTSPYQRMHIINAPTDEGGWDIRMRRVTADSTEATLQNDTYWESYTEIVLGQFIYPDSAVVGLEVNAEDFGTSLPARYYRVKGLKTMVPSNYDPITRTYTGIWDGTFKKAWHSNPAWTLYDIITNDRYGMGEFIDQTIVDKWTLYQIGKYCDESIPSGFKNVDGSDIMEPRFVFSGQINTRKEAYKVIQDITTAFRGMAFWSLGQMFATADMPQDPVTTITNANVINGVFRYSGTALKARHSVASVAWNDPNDFFRPALEVVQNKNAILRYGFRQKDIQTIGCVSRGQAHRYGKWWLDTVWTETETVEFQMSWDGYVRDNGTLKPGDLILVADKRKSGGVRIGGRIKTVTSAREVVLDAPFVPVDGNTYSLNLVLPSGAMKTQQIQEISPDGLTLTFAADFEEMPSPGAMWSITGTDVRPRMFRVFAVSEDDTNIFKISGLFHDPTKYERIEQNIVLNPIAYTRPRNEIKQITNPNAVETRFFQNGVGHSRVILSWSAPDDFLVSEFVITADSPAGFIAFPKTTTPSIDIFDAVPGQWTFYISARSRTGLVSTPVTYEFAVGGWEAVEGPIPSGLQVAGGGGEEFTGTAPTLTWQNVFPADAVIYNCDNVVRVYDAQNHLLRQEVVSQQTYTYDLEKNVNDGGPRRALRFDITARDQVGIESPPVSITVTNPTPAVPAPTVEVDGPSINVSWTASDNDYKGSLVWISRDPNFDPALTLPAYDGPNTSFMQLVTVSGTFYVRVAVYDAFGKTGIVASTPVVVTCAGLDELAFSEELKRLVTVEFQANQDRLDKITDLIASLSSEQDAQNWLDKNQIRTSLANSVTNLSSAIVESVATAQTNAEQALAAYKITVNASIGDLNSSISQVSTAVADLNEGVGAIYTLQLDVNGYVAGMTAFNDGTVSSLTFVADQVKFAQPGVAGGAPINFFSVSSINGVATLALRGDLIADNSVKTNSLAANSVVAGKIAADSISTNHLRADAATATFFTVGGTSVGGSGTVTQVVSMTVDSIGAPVLIDGMLSIQTSGPLAQGTPISMQLQLLIDGAYVANSIAQSVPLFTNTDASYFGYGGQSFSFMYLANLTPGTHTITLRVAPYSVGGYGGTFVYSQPYLRTLEARR